MLTVVRSFDNIIKSVDETDEHARVAQLVERDLAKVEAAGSSPVSRSGENAVNLRVCGIFLSKNNG